MASTPAGVATRVTQQNTKIILIIKKFAQINILFIERKLFKQFINCLPTLRGDIGSCGMDTKLQGRRRNLS